MKIFQPGIGLLALLMISTTAWAEESSARLPDDAAAHVAAGSEKPFKFTLGSYQYGDYAGQDANLRYRSGDSSWWLGAYHDRDFGSQTRVGFDTAFAPFSGTPLSLQPSLQLATQGFAGASLAVEIGEPWFVLAGWGRTNLKPYFNLNFDPNDAITLALGRREENSRTWYLMAVADDRLHTGQKHIHAVWREPVRRGERVTIDVLRKVGEGDAGPVSAWGLSLSYDWPGWFLHLASDPKQNFSTTNAVRLSAGMRF